MKKLSEPQHRFLARVAAAEHGEPFLYPAGNRKAALASSAWWRTFDSLKRLGFVERRGDSAVFTQAGRDAWLRSNGLDWSEAVSITEYEVVGMSDEKAVTQERISEAELWDRGCRIAHERERLDTPPEDVERLQQLDAFLIADPRPWEREARYIDEIHRLRALIAECFDGKDTMVTLAHLLTEAEAIRKERS